MTEDCLLMNEYITSIENFSASFIGVTLNLYFTVNTKYGAVEIKTNI